MYIPGAAEEVVTCSVEVPPELEVGRRRVREVSESSGRLPPNA